jgi:hypothetical protein
LERLADQRPDAGDERGTEPRDRLALLLLVGLAGAFVAHAFVGSSSLIDDAYISFRYARNLAGGHGLVFNEGQRVEGYTNFSWVLLSALAVRAGLSPTWVMPLVGVAAGIGVLVVVYREARAMAREEAMPRRLAGVPAAALVAASPSLAFYASTGLETALYTLFATIACAAIARRRAVPFALATVAAALTRPEAGLLAVVGMTRFAVARDRGPALRAGAILAAGLLPYLAWNVAYFGTLVPNTLAAKPPQLGAGLAYVGWALPEVAGVVVAAAIGTRGPRAILLGLWALQVVAVVAEGGDWMPGQRLLVPALGCLAMAADRPIVDLFRLPRSTRDAPRVALLLAVLANLPLGLLDTRLLAREDDTAADYQPKRARAVERLRAAGVRSLGTLDIGLPGWLAPEVAFVDLGGLTDAAIGRSPGVHEDKAIPEAYLATREPDAFLVLTREAPAVEGGGQVDVRAFYPVERRVLAMPWFAQHYRAKGTFPIRKDYYLVWFAHV